MDEYHEMVVASLSRAGINILPKSFYRATLIHLKAQGMARLMLAKYKGKFIAGTITLFYKDTAYFWDAGWHRDYGSLAPNDLLHWQVIKWANQNRYKYYDLFRLEADRLAGIARWKMKFGGDVLPCYYLSKATPGYRLRRGLKTITNPRRVLSKLRSFMVGRSVTKHEENRG